MKKPIYINKALDFTSLTPRAFEELVYLYFKEQINNGLFEGKHDKVILSSGVGEKGVDSILFLQKKATGAIQCKNYAKNISELPILKEVIKFLLHHILESNQNDSESSKLISNIYNFTYYIIVAKDITQDAKYFLSDFANKWGEYDIEGIVNSLISKYKHFNAITFESIKVKLYPLLNNLNIEFLTGVDLDSSIRSNHQISQRYFSKEKYSDNKPIKELINHLKNEEKYSQDELKSITKFISEDINKIKSSFGYSKTKTKTIDRKEVQEIILWAKNSYSPKDSNIAVLSGNAGMGKTVVMSQLYNQFIQEKTPVLCFKADRFYFNSIEQIEKEAGLKTSIDIFIDQLIGNNQFIVILIDQIDALSLALSSNLKPLKTYDRLIRKFVNNPKIRIIISCRIYDLNYDPIIASYKGKNSFILETLDKETVVEIIKEIGSIDPLKISNTTFQLLETPLHLDVFLKVYSNDLNVNQITSIQDLYSELWKQKIVTNKTGKDTSLNFQKVKDLIFYISSKMYSTQKINLDETLLIDDYNQELEYLKTEGILKGKTRVEFFHQSFFDYSYARAFIKEERNLIQEIQCRHQGLFVRSKIKQILNFKRNVTHSDYIKDIKRIIEDSSIRFHLRLLALQQIAFQNTPSRLEKKIILDIFKKKHTEKEIFLSLYLGDGWLQFLIKNKLLEDDLENHFAEKKDILRHTFNQFINRDNDQLIEYYLKLKKLDGINQLLIDSCFSIKEIKNTLYLDLIGKIINTEKKIDYWANHFLEKAAISHPDFVSKIILNVLNIEMYPNEFNEKNYFPGSEHHSRLYEILWEHHPRKAYTLVKNIINEIIQNRSIESRPTLQIQLDIAYLSYVRKNLDLNEHYKQLNNLQSYLKKEFHKDSGFIIYEVKQYIESSYLTHILIGLSIIYEYPNYFIDVIFEFYSNKKKVIQLYGLNLYSKYLIAKILGKSYKLFPANQKEIINHLIKDFYTDYELKVIHHKNGKKKKIKSYGYSKYELLVELPPNEVMKNPILKKELGELRRKFKKIEKKEEPQGIVVRSGGNTYNNNVYGKMKKEDWKNSFRKYTKNNPTYDSWTDPDEIAHGRMFSKCVSENIDKYTTIVDEILTDNTIPESYKIKGLEGLKNGNFEVKKFSKLFIKAITNNQFDDEQTLYLIWLTEYFSNKKFVSYQILDFLKEQAKTGKEKKGASNDDLSIGINSVRGAAVYHIMDYYFSSNHIDYIYSILDIIIDNSLPSTRVCAISKLQYLLQYGEHKALEYFLKLSKDYSLGIIKIAIQPLQYLYHKNFEQLIPFLKEAMKIAGSHDTIGYVLTSAYCRKLNHSLEIFNDFTNMGDIQINSVLKVALQHIKYDSYTKNAIKILQLFLNNKSEIVSKTYVSAFYFFKENDFDIMFKFLQKYVHSEVGKYRSSEFYKYLLKCANDHPHKCIDLITSSKILSTKHMQKFSSNEVLKVIIQSYNAIREYDNDDIMLEKSMDIFDDFLQHKEYRNLAFDVLSDIDLY